MKSLQSQSSALEWVRERITNCWSLLFLSLVVVLAIFLRCLHLFNPNNYYILSPDSYFFHWLVRKLIAGEGPPMDMRPDATYTLHTGLAYPLAYIAKAVSFVFDLSPTDSLDAVCKFIPLLLGVISLIVIYLVVTRIWDRKVGLFSGLAFAVMIYAVYFGAAGYLDRDGLTTLLLMVGAFGFYLSKYWKLQIGPREVGWLMSGLAVLVAEVSLYLEWGFMGPLLLLAVIVVYFLVKLLVAYVRPIQTEHVIPRLKAALGEANWRVFALVATVNVLILFISLISGRVSWLSTTLWMFGAQGNTGIAELTGITFADVVSNYGFLLIPIGIGLYLAWKKRSDGAIFFACWFVCFLVLSLFANRVLAFAIPATAALSGLGLTFLWDWRRTGQYHMWKKVGVVAFLIILLLVSFATVASIGDDPMIAVDKEWQDALSYIRDTNYTSRDSVVMTQWGWGYWILDIGQRKPFMDNGFYGYDEERMRDVALAYLATDSSEAIRVMDKYGADYLIFSKLDLDYAGTIMEWAGLENERTFPEDSLVVRSLNGQFDAQGDLSVVYRSTPDGEVVILGLTRSE